jgi:hypothetical protein
MNRPVRSEFLRIRKLTNFLTVVYCLERKGSIAPRRPRFVVRFERIYGDEASLSGALLIPISRLNKLPLDTKARIPCFRVLKRVW